MVLVRPFEERVAQPLADLMMEMIRNGVQADQVGCHIITLTHDLLKKLDCLGKSLEQYSLETVRMFHGDAAAAGFTL